MFANSITKPIKTINESMSALADGQFAAMKEHTERKDEFGEMVRNTNSVISKIAGIVGDIKASADQPQGKDCQHASPCLRRGASTRYHQP